MPVGDETTLKAAKSFLERQQLQYTETEEQYCTKLSVKVAGKTGHCSVFNSGKIVVGGSDGPIKTLLEQFKAAYESGDGLPGGVLPFEIDKLPETLQEKVPECDPVVLRFISEAVQAIKANCLLSAAFMLGAASEKAIYQLIEVYGNSISDETNRAKFQDRCSKNKIITFKWDEFKKSYAGCKSKPHDPVLSQDIDTLIGNIFHFSRITRNEVGHPQLVPDLDKGVILANIGNFVQYAARIYSLMRHFKENGVVV
jgi:hypothetical protein